MKPDATKGKDKKDTCKDTGGKAAAVMPEYKALRKVGGPLPKLNVAGSIPVSRST